MYLINKKVVGSTDTLKSVEVTEYSKRAHQSEAAASKRGSRLKEIEAELKSALASWEKVLELSAGNEEAKEGIERVKTKQAKFKNTLALFDTLERSFGVPTECKLNPRDYFYLDLLHGDMSQSMDDMEATLVSKIDTELKNDPEIGALWYTFCVEEYQKAKANLYFLRNTQ